MCIRDRFIVVTRMQDVNSVGITISFSIEPLQAKPELINDLPFQVQHKKNAKKNVTCSASYYKLCQNRILNKQIRENHEMFGVFKVDSH